ncbi:hypothetical protein V7O66_07565 [Methanolobus sp. ZRKC3]|uniref:hypothetical protein n=1 Tax=Methanolobus sp. ZRKC3 TaxID=3125786 RepID=UPI00324C421C
MANIWTQHLKRPEKKGQQEDNSFTKMLHSLAREKSRVERTSNNNAVAKNDKQKNS